MASDAGSRRGVAAAVSDGLDRAVTVACVACILVMLAISFIGFFYMVVTGAALSWTYSLARLFIPWIGLLSITVAFKRGEHIAMTALLAALPAPAVRVLRWVNLAVAGLFAVLLVHYGWEYFLGARQLYMVSDQIQVHARWVAAAVPATGAILLVHMLCGRLMVEPAGPPDLQMQREVP
ncbi:TRAP transporter small permease [Arenibaculum sp.]|jgi:TRAP-type C4-dicarboxylate transport system permease small subunit|uniref:TRAP transporter small permease n=1 Tax=Arenibaculum sp. TaxID=2865862 RepID=UPI002E150A4F|nr:TRAP transporter small permease subunit [Arenibaculum sp.]